MVETYKELTNMRLMTKLADGKQTYFQINEAADGTWTFALAGHEYDAETFRNMGCFVVTAVPEYVAKLKELNIPVLPPKNDIAPTSFALPVTLKVRINEAAKEKGTTSSKLVSQAMAEWLDAHNL